MRVLRRGVGVALALVCLVLVALVVRFVFVPTERIPKDAILVPRDAPTLAAALDRVSPGGTIVLLRGSSWEGPVDVRVANVTLRSATGRAIIAARGSSPALSLHADGIHVTGLALRGDGAGLVIAATGCRVDHVAVSTAGPAVRLSGARDTRLDEMEIDGSSVGLEIASSGATTGNHIALRSVSDVGIRHTASWGTSLTGLRVSGAAIGASIDGSSRDVHVVDSWFENCRDIGILVRDTMAATVSRSAVRGSSTAVRLERATACEVVDLDVEGAGTAIALSQSMQNTVQRVVVRGAHDVAVRLETSDRNTLSGNVLGGSRDAAIAVTGSHGVLVESNEIRNSGTGIRIENGRAALVIRNVVSAATTAILASAADGARILRNRTSGGSVGISVARSTDAVVADNQAVRHSVFAVGILDGSTDALLRENSVRDSRVGILVAASEPTVVMDDIAKGNEVGIFLLRSAASVRVEGCRVESNVVGLRASDDLSGLPAALSTTLLGAVQGAAIGPSVAHCAFLGNRRLDLENTTQRAVRAAGNRWTKTPSLAGSVSRTSGAWTADVVIGAPTSEAGAALGAIAALVLGDAGYHVVDLVGVGDEALVRRALDAGDVQVAVGPKTVATATALEIGLPARTGWVVLVSRELAARLSAPTVSALAALAALADAPGGLLWAAPETLGSARMAALRAAYGLATQVRSVVWTKTLAEAESLLTLGTAHVAVLPSLDETRTQAGFVALADDRAALPEGTLVAAVDSDLAAARPDVQASLVRIAPHLTSAALHQMIAEARLLQRDMIDVAADFLARQGLRAR